MTDATVLDLPALAGIVAEQPYPLLFSTVSGAHLYGFPSRDSDVDLRGVHLLPAAEVVGLQHGPATLDRSWLRDGLEIDLVTHDLVKFARLLLNRNGYVLEQLLSPLVVTSGEAHEELLALAPGCLTHHHAHHYQGFAATQWRLFERTGELKPLLYTYRVLLTGAHLMSTGEVVADLPTLLQVVPALDYLPDLLAAKAGAEHGALSTVPGAPSLAGFRPTCPDVDEALTSTTLPAQPDLGRVDGWLHDVRARSASEELA